MNSPLDGQIKKRVGQAREDTPAERLEQLWQLYLFWKSTPAGRHPRKSPHMYARLFEMLSSGDVQFLILGGAAVSLHGFPRMTNAIDILLQNSPTNIGRFISVISQWGGGCGSNLVMADFQGPGCVQIQEDFPLDVFTILAGKPYEDFSGNAVTYSIAENLEVRCLSISDLIELKKGTLREKDQLDVTVLRRLQANPSPETDRTINLESPPPH